MLPVERRRKMARLIKSQGAVNSRELAKALGISVMTVRRDLKVLEEQKQLEITWGGAVPVGFEAHDIPRSHKAGSMLEAKVAMGRFIRAQSLRQNVFASNSTSPLRSRRGGSSISKTLRR